MKNGLPGLKATRMISEMHNELKISKTSQKPDTEINMAVNEKTEKQTNSSVHKEDQSLEKFKVSQH